MEHEGNNDVFPDRPPDPEKQIQRIGDSHLESTAQLIQIPADTVPHAVAFQYVVRRTRDDDLRRYPGCFDKGPCECMP